MNGLSQIVDQTEAERLATGFVFTEGPLWHPDGFYYFVDVRASKFYRIRPGGAAELLRENTGEGNGTTFDPQGRLILCEGGNRRLTRWPADGKFASSEVLIDRFEGKRLSRPNDVLCRSNLSLFLYKLLNPESQIVAPSSDWESTSPVVVETKTQREPRRENAAPETGPACWCGSVSNWTAPAMWCAAASSPTCPRTSRKACPTA